MSSPRSCVPLTALDNIIPIAGKRESGHDVCSWPKADIASAVAYVRSWGYLPNKYRELKESGLLNQELANLAQDEIEALQKKGYQEHEAREVVLPQLILLPPEEEDDEQSRELAEKEAEYQRNPPV